MSRHFSGSPLLEGNWQIIGPGHKLLNLGDGHILDWEPKSGHYRIWRYDPSKSKDKPFSKSPLRAGTLQNISPDHELIYLGENRLLAWDQSDGRYQILRYDRAVTKRDPFPGPPLSEGLWPANDTEQQVVQLDHKRALELDLSTGKYRVWRQSQTAERHSPTTDKEGAVKPSLFASLGQPDKAGMPSDVATDTAAAGPDAPGSLFSGLRTSEKGTPAASPEETQELPSIRPADPEGLVNSQSPPDIKIAAATVSESEQVEAAAGPPIMRGMLHRAIRHRVSHSLDTIHVDASHQGSEEGTQKRPYRTISAALDRAVAENTVVVAPGLYFENVQLKGKVRLVSQVTGMAIIHGGADRFSGKPTVVGANEAELVGFTITGGNIGIVCSGDSTLVRHNFIRSNYGDYGVLCRHHSRAVIHNNTILGNLGSETNGLSVGVYIEQAEPKLYNNIICGNSIGYVSSLSNSFERYNNIWGNRRNFGRTNKPGPGTISVDPHFVEPARGDYRLQANSRCRNAGRDINQPSSLRNIGSFDSNYDDVVEMEWNSLPDKVKLAIQAFPYISHIQSWNGHGWESAFDPQLGQFWVSPGQRVLFQGVSLASGEATDQRATAMSGDLDLSIVSFGNLRRRAIPEENSQEEATLEVAVEVPDNAVSGWAFIQRQRLESNPIYLEIRRPRP